MIHGYCRSLKKQVNSLSTKLTTLEEELKEKLDQSLLSMFICLHPFMESWNKVIKTLETIFPKRAELSAKSTSMQDLELQKIFLEKSNETNDQSGRSTAEAENQTITLNVINKNNLFSPSLQTTYCKGQDKVCLNNITLENEENFSVRQNLTQTEDKGPNQMAMLFQTRQHVLEGKAKPIDENMGAVLEVTKSLTKDKRNTVALVEQVDPERNKPTGMPESRTQSEENIRPHSPESVWIINKLKESALEVLRVLSDNALDIEVILLHVVQMNRAVQLWFDEAQRSTAPLHSPKEATDFFKMGKGRPTVKQEGRVYSAPSRSSSPLNFPFLTSCSGCYLDHDHARLHSPLIEALNLEYIWTRERCRQTVHNTFIWGQRQGSEDNVLNKKRHAYKTENGNNHTRAFEVTCQTSSGDGVKHLYSKPLLTQYSALTQTERSVDHKASQCLSLEVNLKQTFPAVHGLFSPHCSPTCLTPRTMPTLPEEEGQPAEAQHTSSPPVQDATVEGTTCSRPSIVLPENAVTSEVEIDKNLVNRPHSPHLRHSNRHTKSSVSSLTSVDNTGHVIDLVNDQLPDVKISDEDKKKNLELLEEAKKVSERFLMRRGRKSRSSFPESPTAVSPTCSPRVSPVSSRNNSLTLPVPAGPDICTAAGVGSVSPLQNNKIIKEDEGQSAENAAKGLSDQKQNDQRKVSQGRLVSRSTGFENSKEKLSEQKENFDPLKRMDNLPKPSPSSSDAGKTLTTCAGACENVRGKPFLKKSKENDFPLRTHVQGPGIVAMDPKSKSSVPELVDPKITCKPEPKVCVMSPPLLRAVSWDSTEPGHKEKALFKLPSEEDKTFAIGNKSSNQLTKATAFKDLQIQVQPIRMQKLTKLREEHILLRNQNLVGLKLPDLSEAAEQERGSSPVPSPTEEDAKNSSDVMPSIPDILLRKLRVHKSLPGSPPALTEKEVENVFVQLSLAFRNDSYTLESRINQAERERNLTEEDTEKELENFKAAITSSAALWHHYEHREAYQKLLEDIAVLHRLAARLSSRAEMVGAVRQEKRMSKATEVMMQYVENLKRTYEKDHAELMEYKKLANQNSSRSYSSSEDGVPRSSRSMSLTVGKNMPRRRVSVAVVPKFNLLNIPGQSPSTSPIPSMPALSEAPNGKSNLTSTPVLPALLENGKSNGEHDCESPASMLTQSISVEIHPDTKARIEEEAYNKGYQEGLKKTKELQELKEEDEEKTKESPDECEEEENDDDIKKMTNSKLEVVINYLQILYPKLCKHWNVVWIVAAAMIIFAVMLGIYHSFTSCVELSDGPEGKATCSAVQQYSWWNSGLQHEQRTE
ncbi:PREDICTED: protein MRVI1 isoform X1 [Gavialis gangeticus]|uniref:protein MRVI1 isoform X1 n=2 Tax=Gavialis gangeticus TaxID=94835 RepID=UPI00092E2214|nr:PREDICTED: protein MRVI1 isoform X1 [Gavialis gangeticus]